MSLIGRIEEQKVLDLCLKSNKAEFVVLYGRRRIGKTYLIKEYFNNKFSFYASGVNNCSKKIQLKNFQNSLKDYGYTQKEQIRDWFDAFSALKNYLNSDSVYKEENSGKRIVFLDELPWMDTRKSDFKAALDIFWNTYGSTCKDLVLIVCGSATSWIINNMVKDKGGFYNRITRKIHLLPFDLKECLEYSNYLKLNYTKQNVMECYMVFGGVPYYWSLLNPSLSISQNIDTLCFKDGGELYDEYQALFKSLFSENGKHRDIIEALMKKEYGVTRKELSQIKQIGDGKSLTYALEELIECGFVRSYDNYKTMKNNKFYQIIDPFILFAKSFLINKKLDSYLSYINTPSYYSWCGHAFEMVCLNNIKIIKKALGISDVITKEYSWRSKESSPKVQIDLLIQRRDNVINVCEMKYSISNYTITKEYRDNLLYKIQTFYNEVLPKEQLKLTFITFNPLNDNEYSDIVLSKIDVNDLFN